MDFMFLRSSGDVAFYRSDAEQADWCQEEMTVNASFPYVKDKVIERGMIVLFQDPATNDWQAFEIRTSANYAYDMYQQITAESIAISELTDEHIRDSIEYTDVHADAALADLLSGTGWSVGIVEPHEPSSGDISRGSVWNAIGTIITNWNVYITPRVTVDRTGITAKYLDITSPAGKWNGVRLSIDKNMTDPCVTYDDTELYTALYGYGKSYTDGDETKDRTFDDIVWTETATHPAKPEGQGYVEDPTKTALYGRNGRPRFGYYQNTDIDDGETLLRKTWEYLNKVSSPKINIRGTVADLKRMGYADEPLRLHDMVIVDIEPLGSLEYKQIIKLTIDLLNPTENIPEIGDYIPNIIYINRDTSDTATGGSSGVNKGSSKTELEMSEYKTSLYDTGQQVGMLAEHVNEQGDILNQAGMHIDPDTGVLIYAEDNVNMVGSKFHVQSDRITSEVTDRKNADNTLSSRITQTANQISLEVSERKSADASLSGRIDIQADRISLEVTNRQSADTALSGRITVNANAITAEVTRASTAEGTLSGRITVNADKVAIVVSDDGQGNYTPNSASIVAGINSQTGSYVKIKADTINLSGYVTASQLSATDAKIDNLMTGQSTATSLNCLNFRVGAAQFTFGTGIVKKSTVNIGGTDYKLLTWS